ncbi:MAG: histidine kinase [Myxococcota bacterium]
MPGVTAAARRALSGEAASASGRIGKASLELELATIRDAGGNIAGLSGIALDITQRARLTADLRRLASELIDAEDKERRRFARDLHDSIGQSLPALKLELETFAATRAEPGIAAVASRLGAIHQQVRTLTFELYPAMLDDLGLLATLEHYGRKLGDEGLAVAVAEVGQRRPLSPQRTIFVFRAARELLRNVVKHAGASEAMISLSWQPGVLRLVVADNGRGFDATTPWRGGGLGLFDLRERVAHLGGQLRIDSTPRAGTEVLVDVPLEDPESEAVA